MEIKGNTLVIESTSEAVDVWARPQCADYIGGGSMSVVYAVYDYLGLDISKPAGYQLTGATKGITNFYKKLCANSMEYAKEEYTFSMDDGKHNYPDNSNIVKVLTAYQQNPSKFTLSYVETDTDLQVVVNNLKNDRQFAISVVGSTEEHVAYFVLLDVLMRQQSQDAAIESKMDVLAFLSDN